MSKKKQKICCDVESCKHQNNSEQVCDLEKITVGCDCGCADCKDDTICKSYEKDK